MSARHGLATLAIGAVLAVAGTLLATRTASAGELSGKLPPQGGVALVTWSGGATTDIVSAARAGGCGIQSIWSFPSGFPVGYLVGAPDFVNVAHLAHYPGGQMPAGPILAVCERVEVAPVVYHDAQFTVGVTSNVVYGRGLTHTALGVGAGTPVDLTLDVYRPTAAATTPRPAIVIIHGGSFRGGTSLNGGIVDAARYYAARGWVAFSINYRLADDYGTVPANWSGSTSAYPAIRDAKAAIRWVRANATAYGLDADRITAMGGSAGAISALALGASDDGDYRDELTLEEDWTLATTNPGRTARVATVVDHWGSLSAINALRYYDGRERISANDAPTIIFHGTDDSVVPHSRGIEVRDAYLAAGIPVVLHSMQGVRHSDWNALVNGRSQHAVAIDFIALHQDLDLR